MGPMPEPGRHHHLPAAYRILLALSLALLLHSLVGAAVVLNLTPASRPEPNRVELTLVATGSARETASDASQPATAASESSPTNPARPVPEPVKRGPSDNPAIPEPPTQPDPASTPPAPAQAPATASIERNAGQASPVAGEDTAITSQLPTPEATEPPGYRHELAKRISAQMGRQTLRLPGESRRKQLEPVELEVRLMRNGALVDARVTRSSGHAGLDRSALQAALRASPYPEPPASQGSGALRYRIEFHLESAPPG